VPALLTSNPIFELVQVVARVARRTTMGLLLLQPQWKLKRNKRFWITMIWNQLTSTSS
jgi:hypothetical protein